MAGRGSRREFLASATAAVSAAALTGCSIRFGQRLPVIHGVPISREARSIYALAFLPDGKYALSAGHGAPASILLWDLQRRVIVRALKEPVGVQGISVDETGSRLAVWGRERRESFIAIVEIKSGRVRSMLTEGIGESIDGVWFLGGDRLVSSHTDLRGEWTFARLWDLTSGKKLRDCLRGVSAIAADGRTAIDDHVMWDLESERIRGNCPRPNASGLALSPDGKRAVSRGDGGFLWNERGALLHGFEDQSPGLRAAVFSRDDRLLLSATAHPWRYSGPPLVLRNAQTGHAVAECRGHRKGVSAVAISADSRHALSADEDGNLILWPMPEA